MSTHEHRQGDKAMKMMGVYCCKDLSALQAGMTDPVNNNHYYFKYAGSTNKTLQEVEYNHREETHFFNKRTGKKDLPITMTDFRTALRRDGSNWVFEWLIEPRETNDYTILIDEGVMIRHYKPSLNKGNAWGQNPLMPRIRDIDDRLYVPTLGRMKHKEG